MIGIISLPTALITGASRGIGQATARLFASSGFRTSNHVVFVAFAGGVRQQESVLQRYLDDSQNYPSSGNIMYNILDGAAPTDKIVYVGVSSKHRQDSFNACNFIIDWLKTKGLVVSNDFVIDANCSNVSVQQQQGFFIEFFFCLF